MKKIVLFTMVLLCILSKMNAQVEVTQFCLVVDQVENIIYPFPEDSTFYDYEYVDSIDVTVMMKLTDKTQTNRIFAKLGTWKDLGDIDAFEFDVITDTINVDSVDYYFSNDEFGDLLVNGRMIIFTKRYHLDVYPLIRWGTAYIERADSTFSEHEYYRNFFPGDCESELIIDSLQTPSPGVCNGYIGLSTINGYEPYHYYWNTGDSVNVLTGLCEGIYTVTVIDYDNCSRSETFDFYELYSPDDDFSDTANIAVDTCLIDESLPVDSVFISDFHFLNSDTIVLNWVFWQEGYSFYIETQLNLNYLNEGEVLVFLQIDCQGKLLEDNYNKFYGSFYFNSTSRFENTDRIGVNLYPNPAESYFTVELIDNGNDNNVLSLLDVFGKSIKICTFLKTITLDVSDLTSGVYFLKIKTKDGVITKRIIVN